MTRIEIGGPITSSLTHFAVLGLAEIVEAMAPVKLRVWWDHPENPQAVLEADGISEEEIAREVIGLAARVCASPPAGWSGRTIKLNGNDFSGISPRIKAIPPEQRADWIRHAEERTEILDLLQHSNRRLELQLIGALGEPSYWYRSSAGQWQPDQGASRWEMKTRNRGEEFVQHRFNKLAQEVSGWSVESVLDGIRGKSLTDSIGKNKIDSRTPTGFTRPAPTDNALAWVALWGISAFPLARLVNRQSVTPGAWPRGQIHPRWMVLPVIDKPVSVSRYRNIIVSNQLAEASIPYVEKTNHDAAPNSALASSAASAWLKARKVVALEIFPIQKVGSGSAPERQVLEGRVEPL